MYKLDPAGNETVLFSFTGGAVGAGTSAGVIRDAAGNLYGTNPSGGRGGLGIVYRLDASGVETCCTVSRPTAGVRPTGGVIGDDTGTLYGTAESGGAAGAGVVLQVGCGRRDGAV